MKQVTTYVDALLLAQRTLIEKHDTLVDRASHGDYSFSGGDKRRAADIIHNYWRAAETLELAMLAEGDSK